MRPSAAAQLGLSLGERFVAKGMAAPRTGGATNVIVRTTDRRDQLRVTTISSSIFALAGSLGSPACLPWVRASAWYRREYPPSTLSTATSRSRNEPVESSFPI